MLLNTHVLSLAFTNLRLKALSSLLLIYFPLSAHAALPVIDGAAIAESISQKIIAIEQWARDNLNQARQIEELLDGNNILTDTQNLMDKNFAMEYKHSWEQVSSLQDQSLALLYASKSIWEEYGSANRYYAAFQKAKSWEQCMKGRHCTFAKALENLEDSSISQSIKAYQNAEAMNRKLNEQISSLQKLVQESKNSKSQAGTLDALSKINGSVASSMIDLNGQLAQLTKLQSHELAKQSNEQLASDSYFKEITSYNRVNSTKLPQKLPKPSSKP